MAEALGIAASLVQLADVTIRASLCLYKFFDALRKAQPEFNGHVVGMAAHFCTVFRKLDCQR